MVVDGRHLDLTDDGDPPWLGTGSILVVSVPTGSDPYLFAVADGQTQMISLRTGRPSAAWGRAGQRAARGTTRPDS